jgi:hypothetical protein
VARGAVFGLSAEELSQTALVVGTNFGNLGATADFLDGVLKRGPSFVSPTAFHQSVHHSAAGAVSLALGMRATSLTVSAREISGETALRVALDLLAAQRATRVLVIAVDEHLDLISRAHDVFGSHVGPLGEGAAAILLDSGSGSGGVQVEDVILSPQSAGTLNFAPESVPPRHFGFHGAEGLLRVVEALQLLSQTPTAEDRLAVRGASLGGGKALVCLRRERN